jgi:hypothetical protein
MQNANDFGGIESWQHGPVYTACNYTVGSRRQAPHAGRNQYLGNVWQGMSERVFRHADPARTRADGNAADAGPQKERFAHESNAYGRNVFYDIAQMGVFEPSGRWLQTLDDFRDALLARRSRVADLGVMDRVPTLRDPAKGDFRLNDGSAAVDRGAVVFVPWALRGTVAEWHFYPAGNDPSKIPDEHWYAKDYMTDRDDYHTRPTYPLTAVSVHADDYVAGPLENFTAGALRFDPLKRTYARISHAELSRPFTARLATRPNHGQDPQRREITFTGDALRTADIHTSDFLIEVYLKAEGDGLIISKQEGTGYLLKLQDGYARFSVAGEGGVRAELISQARLTDGQWHHLVAEADRETRTLTLYVDGKSDSSGPGIGKASLANPGDLYVGGRPEGEHLNGQLEFMRIAQGTLADAYTTIEELYAWEFDGPALRDFCGARPRGRGRDAGALESAAAP